MKTEYELIYAIKNCTPEASEALKTLTSQHGPLFHQITNKIFRMESGAKQDFIESKEVVFWKAIMRYDPERCQLPSWIGTFTRFSAFNALKAESKHALAIQTDPHILEEILDSKIDESDEIRTNSEFLDWVKSLAGQYKDSRIKTIINLKFDPENPKNLDEIAKVIGVSKYGVSVLLNGFLKMVRSKMNANSNWDLI